MEKKKSGKINIIFFIDYSEKSGLGHLNRCKHLIDLFGKNKITTITQKKLILKGTKNYVGEFSNFIDKKKYDLAVIDSYSVNYKIEYKIKRIAKKLITVDDLCNRKYCCDYLINYNPYIKRKHYLDKIKKYTNLLLGQKYNFLISNKNTQNKTQKKKNILIYFGTKNRSVFIKNRILNHLNKYKKNLEEIVILSNFKFKYKNLKLKFMFTNKKDKILKILNKTDICFLSTGVMVYEALNLNKLIFVKSISRNQSDNYKFLTKNKYAIPLKNLNNTSLDKNSLDNIRAKLKQINFKFNNSVIFKLIFEPIIDNQGKKYHLEHYSNEHINELYKLQTTEYRKYYLNPSTFSIHSHIKYHKKAMLNDNLNTFIIKNEKNFVGYITTNNIRKKTEVSISIKKDYQNKSVGTKLLKNLLKKKFFLNEPLVKINSNNIYSIKAFKRAGFRKLLYFK